MDDMNMGGSSSNSPMVTMMTPWLHFTGGDDLYFHSMHPSSKGAIAGACIVLVALAIFERWIAAIRHVKQAQWREQALSMIARPSAPIHERKESPPPAELADRETDITIQSLPNDSPSPIPGHIHRHPRLVPPFIAAYDLPRGAMYASQALLGYTLMLAIMTFQAAYIISIIVGLGIGEMVFGRMGSFSASH
ncbi:hypothetical protein JAAARDRAFT_189392 [Jaapia argillacea MUCL 33604]|uniref:Copper transport protein n=1 Tax=Jaapia argillacea MUCL 33604 TaxID=933084 RepID=A0A067QK11_9AGAM|nr:hypothetical protein JAAARDRAFT_189392 [Jaapia argillacea MUCL 33604]